MRYSSREYFTFTSQFLRWVFQLATSRRKTNLVLRLHFEHIKVGVQDLFQLEEIITTKLLSLLLNLYHHSSYYCHNGFQLEVENNHLLNFCYISDSYLISASVHLPYECLCVALAERLLNYLSLYFR